MHIPDGFLSGPVNLAGYAVSASVVGVALARARRTLDERQTPMLGVTAAFVFAAQMLNFPILGGTSGHFLGAALAAILLGPLNACLVMALVLIVQCFGFGDGGLTAVGSNLFNMGVIGVMCAWLVFVALKRLRPDSRAMTLAAAAAASWCSVVAAAAACAAELAISGTAPLIVVMPAMVGVHALTGIGEAVITVAALSLVLETRPDLLSFSRPLCASESRP